MPPIEKSGRVGRYVITLSGVLVISVNAIRKPPDCVEDGVPFSLLFRLGGKLSGELVDALLKTDHAVHQVMSDCDTR